MTKKQLGISVLVMVLFLIWDIVIFVRAIRAGNHIEGEIDFICTCVTICCLIPTILNFIDRWGDRQ